MSSVTHYVMIRRRRWGIRGRFLQRLRPQLRWTLFSKSKLDPHQTWTRRSEGGCSADHSSKTKTLKLRLNTVVKIILVANFRSNGMLLFYLDRMEREPSFCLLCNLAICRKVFVCLLNYVPFHIFFSFWYRIFSSVLQLQARQNFLNLEFCKEILEFR